jgi:hypothetical protein
VDKDEDTVDKDQKNEDEKDNDADLLEIENEFSCYIHYQKLGNNKITFWHAAATTIETFFKCSNRAP